MVNDFSILCLLETRLTREIIGSQLFFILIGTAGVVFVPLQTEIIFEIILYLINCRLRQPCTTVCTIQAYTLLDRGPPILVILSPTKYHQIGGTAFGRGYCFPVSSISEIFQELYGIRLFKRNVSK